MSLIHEPRKYDSVSDAVVDEMLGVALSVLDVVDGSSGVYPPSPQADSCSICVVAHSATPTVSSSHAAPVFAAIGLLREEDVIATTPVRFL